MKKRLTLVAGGLALAVALWFALGRDAAENELASAPQEDSPAATAAAAPPASSILTAELPASTGSLTIAGRVLGPDGPVAGAVVTATVGAGEDVLSDLPCHCTPSCTNRLIECGCSYASTRVAELALSRRGEAPPIARATSAEDGSFVVSGLEPGAYALWAERPGSLIGLRRAVSAGEQNVDVEVSEGRTLRGKVIDDLEEPLAGAVVTAIYSDHARFFDAGSGADGTYSIGPVPRGDLAIVASAHGLLSAHLQADAADRALDDLQLFAPRVISGRAMRDGMPVAGAEVTLEEGHDARRATTDALGAFRFENLLPGTYELVVRQGLGFAYRQLSLEPGKDIRELVLELGEGGVIAGTVRSESGTPLAGAEVTAFGGRETRTDAAGSFRIGPLSAGSYRVAVDATGFIADRGDEVDVRTGATATVDFALRPAAPLSGVVVDAAGEPVPKARVRTLLRSSDKEARQRPGGRAAAHTKRDGTFTLDGLAAGSFDLSVAHEDFLGHKEVVEAPGDGLRIVLERGLEVRGSVEDETGAPVPGARIAIQVAEEEFDFARSQRSEATDARGEFRLGGLQTGDYVVTALERPGNAARKTMRLAVAKVAVHGEGTPPVRLQFKRGESIAGRVVSSDGEPVEGASVRAAPEYPRDRERRAADLDGATFGEALSNADGSFEVQGLEPGRYLLVAFKQGFSASASHEEPVSASTGDSAVSLVLKREGKVHGRVVDEDGKPVKNFLINKQDHHDDGGRFEWPEERDSERELVFEADGYAPTLRRITARLGEDVDLGDVVMTRGRSLSGTVLDAATNQPVPGVLVDVGEPAHRETLDTIRLSVDLGAVETAADGSFTLPKVNVSQPLALFAFHDSYRRWAEPLDPTTARVVIKLDRGGTVVGRVLRADGKPIAGSGVFADVGGKVKGGKTDDAGRFEIKGLALGPATIFAELSDESPVPPQQTVIPAEGVATVELREEADGATLIVRLVGNVGRGRSPLFVRGDAPMPTNIKELAFAVLNGIEGTEVEGQEATWAFHKVPAGPATIFVGEDGAKVRLSRHPVLVGAELEQRLEIQVPATLTEIPGSL